MKTVAKVVSIDNDMVTVVSKRNSACDACHNCENGGACHAQLVFGNQNEEVKFDLKNTVNAKLGDTVQVESSTSGTLLVTAVIFILPIIISLAAYLISGKLSDAEYVPVISTVISFVVSFVVLVKIMNVYTKKHLTAYIVKIVEESDY